MILPRLEISARLGNFDFNSMESYDHGISQWVEIAANARSFLEMSAQKSTTRFLLLPVLLRQPPMYLGLYQGEGRPQ